MTVGVSGVCGAERWGRVVCVCVCETGGCVCVCVCVCAWGRRVHHRHDTRLRKRIPDKDAVSFDLQRRRPCSERRKYETAALSAPTPPLIGVCVL